MATAVKAPAAVEKAQTPAYRVSMEEYLRTSYRPDVEYINGELKGKSLVTPAHGKAQTLLGVWFWQHRHEWGIWAAVEARTQVDPDRVRLPDFVVVVRTNREKAALTQPPLAAIEVLSPTDSYKDLKARATDLASMGVQNVWLIDPEARTGEIWSVGEWQLSKTTQLRAVESPIFLDLEWLWEQMDE